ncbi:HDOD domain-containing protein [Pseudomonas sp. SWI6]|uniref:HDOD domain-containing protein n=1 Tax=Pseudomonas taiwanensis TaxID=470150 RepID=A0ABR6V2N5_9PSED|nr:MULTISPECIES: HDOD domain-containing protein [Pseudomonas]AGZ33342.1 metal-dependent hydrolase HDOD [Pseudomonas sp. VLB120]AVD85073.1 HDOD domain-containing protein [Pseudomonas sp. SWI6]AVD87305.1 HDOD domain-containing protein [Pseudomonas sp. SWI44]MBC3474767.1 HDOD domain-containing protein [Pseudomonas taiwanensis]MBC3491318.1 HDOD domain-containing protein [Pseudomonas taiwanensis]
MPIETKVPTQAPRTLDAWIKLLDSVRLPVPKQSHDTVLSAINDSRRSLRDIAELMQDSPALVLSVMREANHPANASLAEPAESLEIALNRLGLGRTRELLMRLPALPDDDIPPVLRQFLLISQHASQQANGLFASRLARLWQEIHWGSLLFLSPLWPMALAYPKLLDAWELRVIHKGEEAAEVESELFGVRILALCQAVAEHWRLSQWVTQGYRLLLEEREQLSQILSIARDQDLLSQQHRLDEAPALSRWFNQPANTVLLANNLALAAQVGWDNPHLLRWQLLTALYLQTSLEDVQQQVHQQAAASARRHARHALFHPAEALIWPWHQRRPHPDMLAPPPPTREDLGAWRKLCEQMLAQPSPFTNAVHLSNQARQALQACGMQRILLLTLDKASDLLRVQQAAGLPKEAAAIALPVAQNRLLQKLVSKAGQLRLTPENHAQFSALLPPPLRAFFRSEHVLLRSLAVNDQVLMLAVADQGGKPLADVSVQAFGKTAQCIERALAVFATRNA